MWIVPKPNEPSGHILKALRAEYGLTQAEAAATYGLSLRAWQYYEADRRRTPRKLVRSVVERLNSQTRLELTTNVK